MMQLANQYKDDLLTVVLTRNYRSTQPILDLSKSIIGNNNERLVKQIPGLSKELVASGELPAQASLPLLREYETQRLEMIGLALEVRQLVARQVLPGNIAIIYRENRYGEELMRYLSLLGIPVYSKRKINILEAPLAQKLILLLRYLAAELDTPYGGDEMLFELLHADWFSIPPMAIAKLTVEVAEKKFTENRTSLRRLMAERAAQPQQDLFTVSLPETLAAASHSLEELIQDVPNLTLQQLFEKMVRRTGILGKVMNSTDKFHQLQLLTGLFDFIREETRRNPKLNLKQLIGLIDLMEKENLSLPLVQVSGSEKGVNLLTAHGSKGLEFEYVFFAGCNASIWEKKRKPGGGFAYPDTLFESQPHSSDEEELRRLFYVAITRAERHLAISFSRFKNDGKELEPSRFIAELREQMPLDIEKVFISNEELTTFNALQFTETAAPELEALEASFVDRLLDKFVMNVTALSNYLRCPLEFYYATLVRIPSPKNEAAEFGSAVHHALEQLFRKMRESGTETFPDKAEFLNYFDVYMNRHRESFTQEQFNRRMEYGHEVLSKYYEEKLDGVNKIVVIEYSLRNIHVDGIPLKGKLDKLEFEGKSVNVVDYKTGDPDKASAKLKPPDDKNPDGGDYWRQAVFYKLLVDNFEQKGWKVESTEFDFIEPDKKKVYKKVKLKITPADLETLKQQIKRVWEKIQNKEFYTGCGKEDCHWCNFVKNYNLAVALHDITEEPAES
ncbi:MAG: 3'-5' exonuclease [Chitinophagaceae bacterium]